MDVRLLIINGPSPYFLYIPMGTFGLCDFLEKQKKPSITTRIINPSLYPEATIEESVSQHISIFSPTHIAVIFHWQETAHGVIQAIEAAAESDSSVPIILGGITAGYFAREILLSHPAVSCIIKGDPEIPMLQLLSGEQNESIANLTWRDTDNSIRTNSHTWQIDSTLLNTISFCKLNYLKDVDSYINKTEQILGFPLFIGRGCIFNCQYCGGGRHAFNLHSNRQHAAVRSVDAVADDLYRLKKQTDTLYICYENDRKYILTLFSRIADDEQLKKHFVLNYGAWHLIDKHFLDLYQQAFRLKDKKPVFEFSPEVISDQSRKKIKGKASYPLKKLIDNCQFINKSLHGHVRQEVFFSRYHPTETTFKSLLKELIEIFRLKHQFYLKENYSVNICYDHLSTDIAGIYWQDHLKTTPSYETFLKQKQQIDHNQLYPFPVDNLCFYIPAELHDTDCLVYETLVSVLNSIYTNCHELFHILFDCVGEKWIAQLLSEIKHDTTLAKMISQQDKQSLVDVVETLIEATALKNPSLHFLRDLGTFTTTKLQWQKSKKAQDRQVNPDQSYTLNKKRISIHQYNYLDLKTFLASLQEQKHRLTGYQRTVFLFLNDEILSLPHGSFRELLKPFEAGQTIKQYLEHTSRRRTKPDQKLPRDILEKLIANELLVAKKNKDEK